MLARRVVLFLAAAWLVLQTGYPASASPTKHVVIVESMTLPIVQGASDWIRTQLLELGFREEQEVSYRIINAEGDAARAEHELSRAIAEQSPDLVVTVATLASRAARKTLSDAPIPQLFVIVADPVAEGFTDAIGRPSRSNISGRTHVLGADTVVAQVSRVLKKADGEPFRVALLGSSYPSALSSSEDLVNEAKHAADLDLVPLSFPYVPGDDGIAVMLDAAVALVEADQNAFDGLWLAVGPLAQHKGFREALSERVGLPIVFGPSVDAVRGGALMTLTSSAEINGRAVGQMAAATLNGADPGDMPVERPNTFTAAINVSTAIRLGIALPSDLMELAGSQVFR